MVANFVVFRAPHSLGKLIEWKQGATIKSVSKRGFRIPHSLGKLIEWKHAGTKSVSPTRICLTPHSLGKLIEWKQIELMAGQVYFPQQLPTRWGN